MECRFCLELGSFSDTENPLLAPCSCKGSGAYVHKMCLWTWRQTDVRSNQDIKCPVCLSNYDTTIVKIYKRELIPDYKTIPAIIFLLNPINTNSLITYLYLWLLILFPQKESYWVCHGNPCITYVETRVNYTIGCPMIAIHNFLLLIHCVSMMRLIKDIYDIKRYMWTAKMYFWVPLAHRWCLSTMETTPIMSGALHTLIIGSYYAIHTKTLRLMNSEF